MKVRTQFEEMNLDTLRQWVDTRGLGTTEDQESMPEELVTYLEQLEKVFGWHHTMLLEEDIIKNLILNYPELSRFRARKIYFDSINYFYLDGDISQEAWSNVYAERMDKLALMLLKSATTPEQLHKIKDIWKEAATLRGAYKETKEEIPAEFYEKRIVLYTQKLEDVGMPSISRQEVARMIDGLALTEAETLKIKQDADVAPIVLFNPNE